MHDVQLTSIICFGPDGSGKSTLARLLRSYMFSHGVYAYISWFRGSHLFASILAVFLSHFAVFKGCSNPYYGINIPSRLRPLWILIEFFSFLPHYLLRKSLSLLHPVIGDRGVLDFIVWIIVTLNHSKFLTSLLGSFLAKLATMDLAIYVTADFATLHRRVSNVHRSFLLKETACYNVLAKYYAFYTIDTTNKTPRESLNELLKCLQSSKTIRERKYC